jgi:DNA polymerase sigma
MHPKIRLGELDPSENLGVLLVEFFELYGSHFNYNQLGISLNSGGSYFLKMQKGWYDVNKPWLLSIVDPTDDSMYPCFSRSSLTTTTQPMMSLEGRSRCYGSSKLWEALS